MQLKWLGQSSFEIKADGLVIYIDPAYGEYLDKADVILISHFHYDHCSLETVRRIRKDDTTIISTKEVASQIDECRAVQAGEEGLIGNITVTIIPAYNTGKRTAGQRKTHSKEDTIGFLISAEGRTVYYTGDTDFIPEMKDVKADIVIIPVGGTNTMNAKEAASAVKLIKPKTAVPIHYGKTEGTYDDALYFKELAEEDKINVMILKEDKWENI
jgi:L-ascorbate metabolism protein UlaG (beta-lactamase superfamily)